MIDKQLYKSKTLNIYILSINKASLYPRKKQTLFLIIKCS